jgi:hypothetical protein
MPQLTSNFTNFETQRKNEKNNKGNKIENIKFENEIESKRRQIKINIEKKKEEKNSIIKQICDIEKEISDKNLDIELHNNYGKYSNIESVITEIEKSASKKKIGKRNSIVMGDKSIMLISALRVFYIYQSIIKKSNLINL